MPRPKRDKEVKCISVYLEKADYRRLKVAAAVADTTITELAAKGVLAQLNRTARKQVARP